MKYILLSFKDDPAGGQPATELHRSFVEFCKDRNISMQTQVNAGLAPKINKITTVKGYKLLKLVNNEKLIREAISMLTAEQVGELVKKLKAQPGNHRRKAG